MPGFYTQVKQEMVMAAPRHRRSPLFAARGLDVSLLDKLAEYQQALADLGQDEAAARVAAALETARADPDGASVLVREAADMLLALKRWPPVRLKAHGR
jgi:hypothetical protein